MPVSKITPQSARAAAKRLQPRLNPPLRTPLALNPAPNPIPLGPVPEPAPRPTFGELRPPRAGSLYQPLPASNSLVPIDRATLPPPPSTGSLPTPPRVSTAPTGVLGTNFYSPLNTGAAGGRFTRNMGSGARAGTGMLLGPLVSGQVDKQLNQANVAADQPVRAGLTGASRGIALGPYAAAAAGPGMALGQLGVNAIASDPIGYWSRNENGEGGNEWVNRGLDTWATIGTFGMPGGRDLVKKIAAGGNSMFENRDLSVTNALGDVPGIGPLLGGDGEGGGNMGTAVTTAMDAYNKAKVEAGAAQDAQATELATNPDVVIGVARQMGMDPDAAAQLADEWQLQVQQLQVQMERGILTEPAYDIDPATQQPKLDAEGNPKIIERKVTPETFGSYLTNAFNGIVEEMPAIVSQQAQAQAQQQAQMEAQARALQQQQIQAFGFASALDGIMAPTYAAMAGNQYMAPYAGMIRQGSLNLPYLLAAEQQQGIQEDNANQARQLANQQQQMEMAQELALYKARLNAIYGAEAQANPTVDPSLASQMLG